MGCKSRKYIWCRTLTKIKRGNFAWFRFKFANLKNCGLTSAENPIFALVSCKGQWASAFGKVLLITNYSNNMLLGYDIGSSSIKVALLNPEDGSLLGMTQYPESEMPIESPHPDWAEQNPESWWEAACLATRKLLAETGVSPDQILGIGIAYQMHGLVVLDKAGKVLRPAIIWCDSRAVALGNQAFEALGAGYCLEHYLNSPGNFTASKLRWLKENEPEIFARIDKAMLPGDYLAYRMTGKICTTVPGLTEGIFWDFKTNTPAGRLLDYYGIPAEMLPEIVPVFGLQWTLNPSAAAALGLVPGIPLGYRAGDQPNHALSLNVLHPGEVAATGGTSGVVYAVSDRPVFDPKQRVNSFAHVNYSPENPHTGILLCINGAGSMYRWVRDNFGQAGWGPQGPQALNLVEDTPGRLKLSYPEMESLASTVPIGSEGLSILPFGNGAERILGNQNPGAQILGIHFNRHDQRHIIRAALEGIAFAFVQGMEAMREMGIPIHTLRVGNDNLFQSAIFSSTIATLMGLSIECYASSGALGAAKAAGVSVGIYSSPEEAVSKGLVPVATYRPEAEKHKEYLKAYLHWSAFLSV